jgi:hypothetical protein
VVLARLICLIPSESNQHLISVELEHGFDMPKSHIPIIVSQEAAQMELTSIGRALHQERHSAFPAERMRAAIGADI